MKTNLVQTITSDNIILNGLYNPGSKEKSAVIMIHGFTSDFYSHKFFHTIQESLTSSNICNVAVQTRGTGIRTEFIYADRHDGTYIGSFYEKLDEAHLDISAWIEFLKEEGHDRIILLGHSLGTIKSVRYLFEGKYKDIVQKLVLLAPFDKNGYIERCTKGKWKEYVQIANQKISEGLGDEIIPEGYDDYAMSYQNYASWYEDSELSNMWDFYRYGEYDYPILNQIDIPVQVVVGDVDDCYYIPDFCTLKDAGKALSENIKDLDLHIIPGSGHTYVGYENMITEKVTKFILS